MSNPPPNKPGSWGRLSKTIAFWMLVILVPVAFFQFQGAKSDPAPRLDVTQYEDQLDAGNISKVTVDGGQGHRRRVQVAAADQRRERQALHA